MHCRAEKDPETFTRFVLIGRGFSLTDRYRGEMVSAISPPRLPPAQWQGRARAR